MYPILYKWFFAGCPLSLGNFVGVVSTTQVLSSYMNFKLLAQVLGTHRRTLDVPSRKSYSPGAFPLHLPLSAIFRRKLPERKIPRVSFLFIWFKPCSFLDLVECGQFPVYIPRGLKLNCIKVDPISNLVG